VQTGGGIGGGDLQVEFVYILHTAAAAAAMAEKRAYVKKTGLRHDR